LFSGHARHFTAGSVSIAAVLVLLSLLALATTTTHALEDLEAYLPSASELGLLRGGHWTATEYGIETGEKAGPSGEGNIGTVFLRAHLRNPEAKDDDLPVNVRIMQYSSIRACEKYFQFHPIDFYRNYGGDPHIIKQERARSVGEDAFYVIFTNDPGDYLYIQFYFRKNVYYVEVDFSGYSSVEAIHKLSEQSFDITVGSIASLNDAETIARMVEAKLPGGSFVENHPIVSITGIAVGGIVAGFAVAGVASCVAEAGLIVGTTGVAEALISLPLVGGLFSRIIFSPWAMQMVGLYGQYVDDFVLWTTAMVDKVPAAINAVNHYFSEPKPQPRLPDWLRRHRP
jgi:hypothetical protein